MRIHSVIFLVLTALLSTPIYAQLDSNIRAKLYYTEAEKTFAQGDFESSLEYVIEAENALSTVVARTLALKIKIQFNLGNFIEAKELMDAYTADYMEGASQELNDEILSMYISIEEAAEAAEARAAEAKAEAERRGEFTDTRDGRTYQTIQIGNQVWMAENLNYRSGNSSCYENSNSYCVKYGRLYTWETANRVCPAGWHLPSDREWSVLIDYLGGKYVAGTKMKSTSGWKNDGNGTNESGFSGLPGGHHSGSGSPTMGGKRGYWWSSTEHDGYGYGPSGWVRSLVDEDDIVSRDSHFNNYETSVRCLRD